MESTGWMKCFFLTTLLISTHGTTGEEQIVIGSFLDSADGGIRTALLQAFHDVNEDNTILPSTILTLKTPPQGNYTLVGQVCSLLRGGVGAFFGPQDPQKGVQIRSISNAKEVPHIEARFDHDLEWHPFSINFYPHKSHLAQAYADTVESMGWCKIFIVYDETIGLGLVQKFLEISSDFSVFLKGINRTTDFGPVLKTVKKSGVTKIILDVDTKSLPAIFKKVRQIGMMTSQYEYFVTSLDLHTINFGDLLAGETMIKGLRLFNPHEEGVKRLIDALSHKEEHLIRTLKTEAVLMYDAVLHYAVAVHQLQKAMELYPAQLNCEDDSAWDMGSALMNYLRMVRTDGLSGQVEFSSEGYREAAMEIVETRDQALIKIGTWTIKNGTSYTDKNVNQELPGSSVTLSDSPLVHVSEPRGIQKRDSSTMITSKILIVTAVLTTPYVMLREGAEDMAGNDRFEGMSIDLLDEIAKILKFNYMISLSKDGAYGTYNPTERRWSGMIGQLMELRADMAIGDITITHAREKVVDFATPWMRGGISILYLRKTMELSPFNFLGPFSLDVWISIGVTYLVMFILLALLSKLYPDEPRMIQEDGRYVAKSNPTCLGCMDKQRSKTLAVRFLKGLIWFFTLIMLAIYTAILVGYLAVDQSTSSQFESVEDLLKQTDIKYGSIKSGSTSAFFKRSKIPKYQRMFHVMENTSPSVYTSSSAEGVERVIKSEGMYAFLMESPSIEYLVERQCNLQQVGGLLNSKSFGIAFPAGSPFVPLVSNAILELTESGTLQKLKTKWWKQKRGGGRCVVESSANDRGRLTSSILDLSRIKEIFILVLVGVIVALVVGILEYLCRKNYNAKKAQE